MMFQYFLPKEELTSLKEDPYKYWRRRIGEKRFESFIRKIHSLLKKWEKEGVNLHIIFQILEYLQNEEIPFTPPEEELLRNHKNLQSKIQKIKDGINLVEELKPLLDYVQPARYFDTDGKTPKPTESLGDETGEYAKKLKERIEIFESKLKFKKGRYPYTKLSHLTFMLSEYLKAVTGMSQWKQIAKLLNAVSLPEFPSTYFDEVKVKNLWDSGRDQGLLLCVFTNWFPEAIPYIERWEKYKKRVIEFVNKKPKLASYIKYIKSRFEKNPKLRVAQLFKELQKRGYKGSYHTVVLFTKEIRRVRRRGSRF